VAPLVAASAITNISDIDFFNGGSVLHALAIGKVDTSNYTVQKWRDMVMIHRSSEHLINLYGRNFQFERLLTGMNMARLNRNKTHLEHLQVLSIGKYKVLVAAGGTGVDAVDGNGRLIELRTAMRLDWPQVLLRMISSGSSRLVYRNMTANGTLTGIDESSLQQVFGMVTAEDRRLLATKITTSLSTIRQLVGDTKTPFGLSKRSNKKGAPMLVPLTRNSSLLPSTKVLTKPFPKSSK